MTRVLQRPTWELQVAMPWCMLLCHTTCVWGFKQEYYCFDLLILVLIPATTRWLKRRESTSREPGGEKGDAQFIQAPTSFHTLTHNTLLRQQPLQPRRTLCQKKNNDGDSGDGPAQTNTRCASCFPNVAEKPCGLTSSSVPRPANPGHHADRHHLWRCTLE